MKSVFMSFLVMHLFSLSGMGAERLSSKIEWKDTVILEMKLNLQHSTASVTLALGPSYGEPVHRAVSPKEAVQSESSVSRSKLVTFEFDLKEAKDQMLYQTFSQSYSRRYALVDVTVNANGEILEIVMHGSGPVHGGPSYAPAEK